MKMEAKALAYLLIQHYAFSRSVLQHTWDKIPLNDFVQDYCSSQTQGDKVKIDW